MLHASIREVRAAPTLLCLLLSASAFAAGHRQRAQAAESTGHAAQAAREYEEAYREEGAPELLYRLGLVRRRLKQYELSKEAFRGYLRAAPEGELREEVTRQLAELNVLIEEQHRKVPDEEHEKAPPAKKKKKAPRPEPGPPRRGPSATAGAGAGAGAAKQSSKANETSTSTSTSTATPTPTATTTPGGPSANAAPTGAVGGPVRAPQEATSRPRSSGARAAPWIAAGAGALAVGGAALWWDGARVSDDLHARFAAGELDATDGPRYGRARRESIAGRAMIAGAAVLGAIAVALWW